jgi:hypothetical protein
MFFEVFKFTHQVYLSFKKGACQQLQASMPSLFLTVCTQVQVHTTRLFRYSLAMVRGWAGLRAVLPAPQP